MVLHNLFFLVLTCAAYFTLIPLFEKQLTNARKPARSGFWSRRQPAAWTPIQLTGLPPQRTYEQELRRAKLTLFLVLGSIYVLAVLLLESIIMPRVRLQPLRQNAGLADAATQAGDRRARIDSGGRDPGRRDRLSHALPQ